MTTMNAKTVKTTTNFNTQPLINQLENVINKEVSNILKDFMERYQLLEETHKQIMNLPSVTHELNGKTSEIIPEEEKEEPSTFSSKFVSLNHPVTPQHITLIELRISRIEKRYEEVIPVLEKILEKINKLDSDIKSMRNVSVVSSESVEKSTVVQTSKNENIELHIFEEATPITKNIKILISCFISNNQ